MLKQPVGIVKLTNVALIKYKIKGKRFEIACYKNKAIDWRNGVETSLSEVLQVEQIFTDAVKGKKASKADLKKCFGSIDKEKMIEEILQKGTMQISEKERELLQESNQKDILNIISNKIVHPVTKKKFSLENIREALKQINFNIVYNKVAKKLALEAIKQLEQYYEIERTGKLVKLKFTNTNDWQNIQDKFKFEIQKNQDDTEKTILIGHQEFKNLESFIQQQTIDKVQIAILDHSYYNKESQNIDDQILSTLQLKKGIVLPKQMNQSKNKRKISEQIEEKKEVIGFNSKKFQQNSTAKKMCNTCQKQQFDDLKLYKEHIRSDWHKFNLKRKMKGLQTLNEEQYKEQAILEGFCQLIDLYYLSINLKKCLIKNFIYS